MTAASGAGAPALAEEPGKGPRRESQHFERDEKLIEGARVVAHLGRVMEKACDAVGVTISQYRILSYVGFQAQRAGELADRAAVSRPTLTVALDTLEQRGLVRRERVPGDRRGIRLELTESGRDALARAEEALSDQLRRLVPPDELDNVLAGLAVIGAGMRAQYERQSKG